MEEHRPGGHGGGGEEGGEGVEGVEEEETFADEGEGGDGDGEAGEGRAEGEGEGEGEEVDVCLECVLHAFLDPVVSDARTSGGDARGTCLCLCCCRQPSQAPAARASAPRGGGLSGGRGPPGRAARGTLGAAPRATLRRVLLQSLCSASSPAVRAHIHPPGAASTTGSAAQTTSREAATGDATSLGTRMENRKKANKQQQQQVASGYFASLFIPPR